MTQEEAKRRADAVRRSVGLPATGNQAADDLHNEREALRRWDAGLPGHGFSSAACAEGVRRTVERAVLRPERNRTSGMLARLAAQHRLSVSAAMVRAVADSDLTAQEVERWLIAGGVAGRAVVDAVAAWRKLEQLEEVIDG